MPRGYVWSEDLADDYMEAVLSIDAVAAKYGLGRETLMHLARSNGWKRAGKHDRHLPEVAAFFRAGLVTNGDLAEAYGIPVDSLSRMAREQGWRRVVRSKGGRGEHRGAARCGSMIEQRLRVVMLHALEVRA